MRQDRRNIFSGYYRIQDSLCGQLASNQLVHACVGNPVPFSKVPGQVLQDVNYEKATVAQGDLEVVLFTDRRACVGVIDPELGLRHTALPKTRPSN